MKCLVFVKFLPDGSMRPEEFFSRVKASWSSVEEFENNRLEVENTLAPKISRVKSGICVTDYDSVEQLSIDLAVMPGAGISNVEIIPVVEEFTHTFQDSRCAISQVSSSRCLEPRQP